MDDEEIRGLVTRLSRPDGAGGGTIERATILAEGTDSTAILAWIAAHDGQPEALVPVPAGRGLHSARLSSPVDTGASAPRRYVLPPGSLS